MPVYEYRCENGHTFEVTQRMSDDPVTACQICGAPVQRVFHPVAVHFKGSGFYATDYGRKKGKGASDDGGGGSDSGAKKESGDQKASPATSEAGSSATGSSSSGSGTGTRSSSE
jgi:putative FmdB family regulatory protein